MSKKPIGVFDSGIGGLTILKSLRRALPHERLIYFGDTANVPYGGKSKQAVTHLSMAVARFLESRDVKLIVVACNTASAQALGSLRKQLNVPVMGVIEPGAQCAVQSTRNHKIAVLGTQGTVESKAYLKAIQKRAPQTDVFQKACPLFVPLAEEGFANKPAAELIAREYLSPVQKSGADTVILGCTHYPILKDLIARIMGPQVHLVDSADTLAQAVKLFLQEHHLAATTGKGGLKLYSSDAPKKFTASAQKVLGEQIPQTVLKKLNA
ncbi:MAG: glutamate racemase [Elusimicrobiaceae bacterium]|nr:glutamate racemase [Elusimicrobiaceae bacterium]